MVLEMVFPGNTELRVNYSQKKHTQMERLTDRNLNGTRMVQR